MPYHFVFAKIMKNIRKRITNADKRCYLLQNNFSLFIVKYTVIYYLCD